MQAEQPYSLQTSYQNDALFSQETGDGLGSI